MNNFLDKAESTEKYAVEENERTHRNTVNWPLLGFARFLLASIVMCAHFSLVEPNSPLKVGAFWLNHTAAVFAFLWLSGMAIHTSYAREKRGFFARRAVRIFPVYYAGFALSFVPHAIGGPLLTGLDGIVVPAADPLQILQTLLCLQPLFYHAIKSFWPSWSLGVEVLFYATTPFIARLPRNRLLGIIATSALAFVYQAFSQGGGYGSAIGPLLPLCLYWIWLLGWVLPDVKREYACVVVALTAGLLAIVLRDGGPLLVTLTSFAALYGARVKLSARVAKVFAWLGDLSYPLYIVHFQVALIFVALKGPYNIGLAICASLLISVAVLYCVDYPCRALFKKYVNGHDSKREGFGRATSTRQARVARRSR